MSRSVKAQAETLHEVVVMSLVSLSQRGFDEIDLKEKIG